MNGFPQGPKGDPGPVQDDAAKGRDHEYRMMQLHVEEQKRRDAQQQWRYQQRARWLVGAAVFVLLMTAIVGGVVAWYQATENRGEREQVLREACINQGGTPVDLAVGWQCLYLQKEPS